MNEIYLIGLGNPGKKYSNSRHNIGFLLLENLSKKYNSTFLFKDKLKSSISEFKINNSTYRLFLISLIQALTVLPLTSISQAPQLPVRQPVGISKPAFSAEENQLSPSETKVSLLFGHITLIFVSFNLKMI